MDVGTGDGIVVADNVWTDSPYTTQVRSTTFALRLKGKQRKVLVKNNVVNDWKGADFLHIYPDQGTQVSMVDNLVAPDKSLSPPTCCEGSIRLSKISAAMANRPPSRAGPCSEMAGHGQVSSGCR